MYPKVHAQKGSPGGDDFLVGVSVCLICSRFDASSPGRQRGRGVKRVFVGSGFSVAGGRGAGWVGDKKEAEESSWDRHMKCPKSQ